MSTNICLNYPIGEDNYFIKMEYSQCLTTFLKIFEELLVHCFGQEIVLQEERSKTSGLEWKGKSVSEGKTESYTNAFGFFKQS